MIEVPSVSDDGPLGDGRDDGVAPEDRTVVIEVPAELRYVPLTRVAAASMAADLDAVIDDVEDLRVAVNELVGLLVDASDGGRIRLRMWCDGTDVLVHGTSTGPSAAIAPDDLTRRILDATVDDHVVADGTFELRKHLHTA